MAFKNSSGVFLTRALFFETTDADKSSVVYTLKDDDHLVSRVRDDGTTTVVTYPSLKKLYLACDDPTEYSFATQYLAGWRHWEELCECSWFKPYLSEWRRELELKLKSEALAKIRDIARKEGKEKLSANRFLVEKGWEPKEGQNKRGRPSKEEISKAAKEISEEQSRILQDAQRLNLETLQ